jgi:hypothetical protein
MERGLIRMAFIVLYEDEDGLWTPIMAGFQPHFYQSREEIENHALVFGNYKVFAELED